MDALRRALDEIHDAPAPAAAPVPAPAPPTTIGALLDLVKNPYQVANLCKILPGKYSFEEVYMTGYEPNTSTDRKKQHIAGTFQILGSQNMDNVRARYEVRLYRPGTNDKGSFWCSCPDHKFNASKRQTCCKHICMIVCKVARILDPAFFETRQLTQAQFDALLARLSARDTLLATCPSYKPALEDPARMFTDISRPPGPDDVCPICFDAMEDAPPPPAPVSLLSCPGCRNCIHRGCMEVWLEGRRRTCVFCRSDLWEHYQNQ